MPILIEYITELVLAILFLILLADAFVISLTISRRQRRDKYFQRIDDIRQRYGPVVAAVLTEKIECERGIELLKGISGIDREFMLEQLVLNPRPKPSQIPVLRRLSEDLGLVKVWQRNLIGKVDVASFREALASQEGILKWAGRLRFLLRAKAAENLATVRHQPSCPLLVKALDDPHPDVQSAALRGLAAIKDAETFPALVQRLQRVIMDPHYKLSLRSTKSALVSFPLQQAAGLIASLQHSHRRLRFLATDIVREMVEREAGQKEDFVLESKIFPQELSELFLAALPSDENPDVRARTTPVIAYLADPRSTPVLLTLLEDSEWFVRLHAVRALGKRKFLPQVAHIARHLTDSHWMVREAAARALLVFGQAGTDQLSEHFLSTEDRYSREQIADEIQRTGLLPTLLTQYANETDGRRGRVIGQLAQMGKTSYMVAVLVSSSDRNLHRKFLEDFGRHQDTQVRAWVNQMASREHDPELRTLAQAALDAGKS